MNSYYRNTSLIFTYLFLIIYQLADGQSTTEMFPDSVDLFSLIQKTYRQDQILVNGIYNENYYRNALGHPYLKENRFYPGQIIVHNQLFDNINIKFNIYNQNLVIAENLNSPDQVEFIPPNNFVTGFKINGKLFRKYLDEEGKERFFQVVFDGTIKCLFHWTKERVESFHNVRLTSYRFNEELRNTFLYVNNRIYRYKTSTSFMNLFPKEVIPEIKAFCRKEKISPSTTNEQETVKLFNFCEMLLKKNQIKLTDQPKRTN